jgi:hypothetical protein
LPLNFGAGEENHPHYSAREIFGRASAMDCLDISLLERPKTTFTPAEREDQPFHIGVPVSIIKYESGKPVYFYRPLILRSSPHGLAHEPGGFFGPSYSSAVSIRAVKVDSSGRAKPQEVEVESAPLRFLHRFSSIREILFLKLRGPE